MTAASDAARHRRHDERFQKEVLDALDRMHQVLHDISDSVGDLAAQAVKGAPADSPVRAAPGSEPPEKLLFTVQGLAAMTGLSRSAIYQLRHANEGPVPTKVGSRLFFHRDDIAAWLDRHRQNADDSDTRPWREGWMPGRIGRSHPRSSEPQMAPWCTGSHTEPMAASRYPGRNVCRICRGDVLVNRDGRLRKHHPRGW